MSLISDASDHAVGAVLVRDGQPPHAHFSQALPAAMVFALSRDLAAVSSMHLELMGIDLALSVFLTRGSVPARSALRVVCDSQGACSGISSGAARQPRDFAVLACILQRAWELEVSLFVSWCPRSAPLVVAASALSKPSDVSDFRFGHFRDAYHSLVSHVH